MDKTKFRTAALEALALVKSPHATRAMALVNADSWGGSMGVYHGQDYIILNVPGERDGCCIVDDEKKGINGQRIAAIMISIARHEFERSERERIGGGNEQLAGRCRNMFTHLTHPAVSVAPSVTREGHVRLNGWGEYTEGGVKVVFDALKAADKAITEWAVK